MEIAVGIAIGVLVVVVMFSTAGLVFLVKTKCCKKDNKDHISQGHAQNKNPHSVDGHVESPGNFLIDDDDGDNASITLQNVLDDDVWIDDMSGVMGHCIPILKSCHNLTSRLVPITQQACQSHEQSQKVEELACQVNPRLEDVVQLLEGPLDPRLVEARCTALYYAVSNLCLVIKSICPEESIGEWIDLSLKDTETHLKVLQDETQKLRCRTLSRSASGRGSTHGADDMPPISNLSTTHSSGSRGSSTHTDSTESGIDMRSEVGGGPSSPQYKLKRQHDLDNNIVDEVAEDDEGRHTVVEIHHDHHNNEKEVIPSETDEVIEMENMTNGGFVDDSESTRL